MSEANTISQLTAAWRSESGRAKGGEASAYAKCADQLAVVRDAEIAPLESATREDEGLRMGEVMAIAGVTASAIGVLAERGDAHRALTADGWRYSLEPINRRGRKFWLTTPRRRVAPPAWWLEEANQRDRLA